jgi:hypothetical protein
MGDLCIVIAGRSRPIPFLAPRQNRIVVPRLMALGARPAADYDNLLEIVFAALTRAHPSLSRHAFDNWPIATFELLDALATIARQTGLMSGARSAGSSAFCDEAPDWDAIIAQFVNFLPGTTPDYWEDALTVPRLEAMREEWRRHPPLTVMVASWLGYKPRPRDVDAAEELMRLFPDGQLRLN